MLRSVCRKAHTIESITSFSCACRHGGRGCAHATASCVSSDAMLARGGHGLPRPSHELSHVPAHQLTAWCVVGQQRPHAVSASKSTQHAQQPLGLLQIPSPTHRAHGEERGGAVVGDGAQQREELQPVLGVILHGSRGGGQGDNRGVRSGMRQCEGLHPVLRRVVLQAFNSRRKAPRVTCVSEGWPSGNCRRARQKQQQHRQAAAPQRALHSPSKAAMLFSLIAAAHLKVAMLLSLIFYIRIVLLIIAPAHLKVSGDHLQRALEDGAEDLGHLVRREGRVHRSRLSTRVWPAWRQHAVATQLHHSLPGKHAHCAAAAASAAAAPTPAAMQASNPQQPTSVSILPRRRLMIMANMDSTSASLQQRRGV